MDERVRVLPQSYKSITQSPYLCDTRATRVCGFSQLAIDTLLEPATMATMKNFKNHFNHIEDARYSVGALSAFRSVNAQDVIFKVPGDNRQFQQVASFSAHSIDAALDGLFDEQFNPKQVQFIRVTQFRKDMNGRNQSNASKIFPYGC